MRFNLQNIFLLTAFNALLSKANEGQDCTQCMDSGRRFCLNDHKGDMTEGTCCDPSQPTADKSEICAIGPVSKINPPAGWRSGAVKTPV